MEIFKKKSLDPIITYTTHTMPPQPTFEMKKMSTSEGRKRLSSLRWEAKGLRADLKRRKKALSWREKSVKEAIARKKEVIKKRRKLINMMTGNLKTKFKNELKDEKEYLDERIDTEKYFLKEEQDRSESQIKKIENRLNEIEPELTELERTTKENPNFRRWLNVGLW